VEGSAVQRTFVGNVFEAASAMQVNGLKSQPHTDAHKLLGTRMAFHPGFFETEKTFDIILSVVVKYNSTSHIR
jgi:hypothetical protein